MKERVDKLLSGVIYQNWQFLVKPVEVGSALELSEKEGTTHYYLQAEFEAYDHDNPDSGELVTCRGRKWLLSPHMTDTEIVQTAFLAVLKAEEHETRESFLVHGKAIFNTHIKFGLLTNIADVVDLRSEPSTTFTAD